MVTLHILQYLQENGFGTREKDLFFQKLPSIDKDSEPATGIAIISRGGARPKGRRRFAQNFDLYCRGTSDTVGADKLDKIGIFLADSYGNVCDLPTIPDVSLRKYKRVVFDSIGEIENLGKDENDRVIFRLSAQVIYTKVG